MTTAYLPNEGLHSNYLDLLKLRLFVVRRNCGEAGQAVQRRIFIRPLLAAVGRSSCPIRRGPTH